MATGGRAAVKPELDEVLKNLRLLLAVSEEGQFQRAAARLEIDGAAVSRRIKLLEQALGFRLFTRRAAGAQPTAAAAALCSEARDLVARLETVLGQCQKIAQGTAGLLRVGYVEVASQDPAFAFVINRFKNENPGVEVRLLPMFSAGQVEALRNGDLDAGFILKPLDPDRQLEYCDFAVHRMLLAVPRASPLALQTSVRIAQLRDVPMLWPDRRASPLHAQKLLDAFAAAGVTPRIVAEVSTSQTVFSLVAAGMGLGFIDGAHAEECPAELVLRVVADYPVPITLQVAWNVLNTSLLLKPFLETACPTLAAP
jgi:DNA-binding transcriptional LysR family regulator